MSLLGKRVARLEVIQGGRPDDEPAMHELQDAAQICDRRIALTVFGEGETLTVEDRVFLAACKAGMLTKGRETIRRYDRFLGIDRCALRANARERITRLF